MDNFKMIYSIPFLFFTFVSCSNSSTEMVAKSKYDAQIAEYKELNEQQAAVIEDNLEKSKIINNVVTELNQIAGNTQSLRVNGVGELSQAEEINRKLQILKKRLTAVEGKRSDSSKNLLATMDNLKSIIEQKEIEINNLKQEIANQQQTIANQKNTIANQQVTIDAQSQELMAKQQEMWYKLGVELHSVVEELPKVKGRKDKRNIKNTRYYILNKAKECFEHAAQLGHSLASSTARQIEGEMSRL